MLDNLLGGQVKPVTLLLWALMVFLYLLPALIAFHRAHRHFWILAVLNLLVSPAQSVLLHYLMPGLLTIDPAMPAGALFLALLVNLGPGWLILMGWALMKTERRPELVRAQDSKLYDALAALPLILWFGYGALQLRPTLGHDLGLILAGQGSLFTWVRLFSLGAAMGFDLLLVWLLIVRDKPVLRAKGLVPRLCAVVGTFLGVGILQLPVAQLGLPMQLVAAALVGLGSLGSILVLWRLGKAFSIMPEARVLVTTGPYARARHPLYAVEIVSVTGTALQFAQPWAFLIAAGVVAMLVIRSVFEERVLLEAYPEYEAYRARTERFIPGIV